jgi:hypothetical protein
VVAATGFGTVSRSCSTCRARSARTASRGSAPVGRPAFPGLYFMGFDETVSGHLFEARRESKRLARSVAAYLEQSGEATATRS